MTDIDVHAAAKFRLYLSSAVTQILICKYANKTISRYELMYSQYAQNYTNYSLYIPLCFVCVHRQKIDPRV